MELQAKLVSRSFFTSCALCCYLFLCQEIPLSRAGSIKALQPAAGTVNKRPRVCAHLGYQDRPKHQIVQIVTWQDWVFSYMTVSAKAAALYG